MSSVGQTPRAVNNAHELICSHNSFRSSNICSADILCYTSNTTHHQRLKNWLTVNLTFGIKFTRRVSVPRSRGATFPQKLAEARVSRNVRVASTIKARYSSRSPLNKASIKRKKRKRGRRIQPGYYWKSVCKVAVSSPSSLSLSSSSLY